MASDNRIKSGTVTDEELARFRDVCTRLGLEQGQVLALAIRGVGASPGLLGPLVSAAACGPVTGSAWAHRGPTTGPVQNWSESATGPTTGPPWGLGGPTTGQTLSSSSSSVFRSTKKEEEEEEEADGVDRTGGIEPADAESLLDLFAGHEELTPFRRSVLAIRASGEPLSVKQARTWARGDLRALRSVEPELKRDRAAKAQRAAERAKFEEGIRAKSPGKATAGPQDARESVEASPGPQNAAEAPRGGVERVSAAVKALVGGKGVVA